MILGLYMILFVNIKIIPFKKIVIVKILKCFFIPLDITKEINNKSDFKFYFIESSLLHIIAVFDFID